MAVTSSDELLAHLRKVLAGIYGGQRWILATDVPQSATPLVKQLAELGVARCLCIAAAHGTGELPDPVVAPDPIVLDVRSSDVMGSIRATLAALADLPEPAVARIDAFDPAGVARVIGTIWDDGRPVAGRRKWGARLESWQALEDKTVIDALWDEIGVERAPSEIVATELLPLLAASTRLDRGLGSVWVADNREGFHGGATYLRWVRSEREAREAAAFLAMHSDRARVMPFLEGLPCSIHGIAFADCTIAFRPCELIILRRRERSELHYSRAATFWDPAPDDREAMRVLARRVGDHLRLELGYRGAFNIDGVMTADGFRPTELNPRFGAALSLLYAALPDLSLMLLQLAVTEGIEADYRPSELERLIVDSADAHRRGGGLAVARSRRETTVKQGLAWTDSGQFQIALDDRSPDAIAVLGPAAAGAFLSLDLVPERTPVGPSAAPRIAAALAWADGHYELGIGPLEPAKDVRAERLRVG